MDVVTANELLSGAVVYLTARGAWEMDIDKARLFGPEEAEERDALIAKAKRHGHLVGIEAEKVKLVDGRVVADRLRERIRAEGPTAPYGPERQTIEEADEHVSL